MTKHNQSLAMKGKNKEVLESIVISPGEVLGRAFQKTSGAMIA